MTARTCRSQCRHKLGFQQPRFAVTPWPHNEKHCAHEPLWALMLRAAPPQCLVPEIARLIEAVRVAVSCIPSPALDFLPCVLFPSLLSPFLWPSHLSSSLARLARFRFLLPAPLPSTRNGQVFSSRGPLDTALISPRFARPISPAARARTELPIL